ncbi:hypothetical protein Cni_G08687 [Canna indica]|uniref:Uncharacterized protein n=1 Tax=Canna indica TaxID=4628 RepID=A0AAQ3Q5Y4_9LILI|nr:hypothetical protein Cni_G08687 [Canna indica]
MAYAFIFYLPILHQASLTDADTLVLLKESIVDPPWRPLLLVHLLPSLPPATRSSNINVDALAHFKGLRSISLNNNNFAGPLPLGLARLSTMKSLFLSYNHFSSEIPKENEVVHSSPRFYRSRKEENEGAARRERGAKNCAREREEMGSGRCCLFTEILISIILPPLGVFLHYGCCSCEFCICLLLTILGYVPGIIYAIYVLVAVDHEPYRRIYYEPLA